MVTAGVLVEDTSTGRMRTLRGQPVPTYQVSDRDLRRVMEALRRLGELLFEAGARRLYLPFGTPERVVDSADGLSRATQDLPPRRSFELMTVHLMGTAAMGGDARRHVCDPLGRVRGTPGLYVADASLCPSAVGVNPMETIMMLASRGAAAVVEDLAGGR